MAAMMAISRCRARTNKVDDDGRTNDLAVVAPLCRRRRRLRRYQIFNKANVVVRFGEGRRGRQNRMKFERSAKKSRRCGMASKTATRKERA